MLIHPDCRYLFSSLSSPITCLVPIQTGNISTLSFLFRLSNFEFIRIKFIFIAYFTDRCGSVPFVMLMLLMIVFFFSLGPLNCCWCCCYCRDAYATRWKKYICICVVFASILLRTCTVFHFCHTIEIDILTKYRRFIRHSPIKKMMAEMKLNQTKSIHYVPSPCKTMMITMMMTMLVVVVKRKLCKTEQEPVLHNLRDYIRRRAHTRAWKLDRIKCVLVVSMRKRMMKKKSVAPDFLFRSNNNNMSKKILTRLTEMAHKKYEMQRQCLFRTQNSNQ